MTNSAPLAANVKGAYACISRRVGVCTRQLPSMPVRFQYINYIVIIFTCVCTEVLVAREPHVVSHVANYGLAFHFGGIAPLRVYCIYAYTKYILLKRSPMSPPSYRSRRTSSTGLGGRVDLPLSRFGLGNGI
eukprot:jgi/Botrbrau1/8406/Bobra.0237s0027.1